MGIKHTFFYFSIFFLFGNCSIEKKKELVPFDNGNGLWGYKDCFTHKESIAPKYAVAYPFINNHAIVGFEEDGRFRFGVIDTLDNYILSPEYERIHVDNGYIHARKGDITRLLELGVSNGNSPVVPKQPAGAKELDPDSVTVTSQADKRVTVADKAGKILFSERYGWAGLPSYKEGLMAFIKRGGNGKWGFIDTQGKQAIPYMYDFVDSFGFIGGFSVVSEKGENPMKNKNAVINKKNELVLPYAMDSIYTILEDSSICIYNRQINKMKLLDNKLKEVIPYRYELIKCIGEGYYKGKTDSLYAVVDKWGKECLPAQFADISKFKNGMCIARCATGKEGFINTRGELAIPCKYKIEYEQDNLFGNGFVYAGDDSLASQKKTRLLDKQGKEYIVRMFPARIIK